MAEYDVTARMAENLDRHLVFPLLEFLQERILYADEDILKSKIQLLNITNVVDYAMDIHKSLYHSEDVPAAMVERVAEVVARLKSLEETTTPIVLFLQNPSAFQELRADRQYNLQMLHDHYQAQKSLQLVYLLRVGEDESSSSFSAGRFGHDVAKEDASDSKRRKVDNTENVHGEDPSSNKVHEASHNSGSVRGRGRGHRRGRERGRGRRPAEFRKFEDDPDVATGNNMIGVVDLGIMISMCDGPQYWSSFKEVH